MPWKTPRAVKIFRKETETVRTKGAPVSVRKMKNSELKEYLNTFPDDADVSVIIANPKGRKVYPLREYGAITDMGYPVFCLEVGEEKPFDEEMIAATEEDERNAQQLEGQMEIADFPEVLP